MDVCVIIVIAINGLKGLGVGLVLALFNIASYIVAGIIARIYYPSLSEFVLEKTNWALKLQEFIYNNMGFISSNNMQNDPASYENVFEMMNLPKALEGLFVSSDIFQEYSQGVLTNINVYMSQMISKIIIDLLSIIVIFFIAKIALDILGTVLNGIASLPLIKQFNRLGGLIFGVLKGIFIIYIFTAIMVPIVSVFPNSSIVSVLETSSLTKMFYDYNILLYMLKNIATYSQVQIMNSF